MDVSVVVGTFGDSKWADLARTRAAVGRNDATSLGRYDFNRDGVVNAAP